jgi:hypothetical protein
MADFSKLAKAAEELLAILKQKGLDGPQHFDGAALKAPLPATSFDTGRGTPNRHATASVGIEQNDFLPEKTIEGPDGSVVDLDDPSHPDYLAPGQAVYGDTSKKKIDKRAYDKPSMVGTGKDVSAQGLPNDTTKSERPWEDLHKAAKQLEQVLAKANPPPAPKVVKPQYSAAILTPESQAALLKAFPGVHPNVIAHHMTLAFGPKDDQLQKLQDHVNKNGGAMKLRVKAHHQDEHGQAVSIEAVNPVTGQPLTANGGPLHITISHNGGSKPGPDGKPIKNVHPTLLDAKGKPVPINAAYSNHLVQNVPGTPVDGMELDANIGHVMPDNSEVLLQPKV